MIFYCDFDGTIVEMSNDYEDTESPLILRPFAREALYALVAANHDLVLWSARASPTLLDDPTLDPLVRAGVRVVHQAEWERSRGINLKRYEQMLDFCDRELPGVFCAVSDGREGKPSPCDMFIEDKVFHGPPDWYEIARMYGAPMGLVVVDAVPPRVVQPVPINPTTTRTADHG